MKRVTAIGGIFFKSSDPEKTNEWYNKHLGIPTSKYGAIFNWRDADDAEKKGMTVWNPFKADTKYFEPSGSSFMINYIVEDLEGLVAELKNEGVTVVDEIQSYDYGKFVHIMDPDGNKIELWEPAAEK